MLGDEWQLRRNDKVQGPRLDVDQRKRPFGNGVGLAALICRATKKLLDRDPVPPIKHAVGVVYLLFRPRCELASGVVPGAMLADVLETFADFFCFPDKLGVAACRHELVVSNLAPPMPSRIQKVL